MNYYLGFKTITDPVGNNALNHEERVERGSKGELFIPLMKKATYQDLAITDKTTFEVVENGKLCSFSGFEALIEQEKADKRIYFIDNHNHAFYGRYKAQREGTYNQAHLVHIDQHSDLHEPTRYPEKSDLASLEAAATYTNEVLQVGSFIQPALAANLITSQTQLRSEYAVLNASPLDRPSGDIILDIDLDFRAPEMNPDQQEETIAKARKLMNLPQVKIVTIATSPYFLGQKLAFDLIGKLMD